MQPTNPDIQTPQTTDPQPTGAAPQGAHAANNRQPVGNLRELFWQNVIREMLTSLSMMSMQIEAKKSAEKRRPGTIIIDTPAGQIVNKPADEASEEEDGELNENLFDGRLAVITTLGTRIPIAEVHPLFACGVTGNSDERSLATAVECSVFQISTPPGEVYTLPLSEIRGFHSLSPKLVQQLQREAELQMQMMSGGRNGETEQPFGFAAFTSLARAEQEQNNEEIDRS